MVRKCIAGISAILAASLSSAAATADYRVAVALEKDGRFITAEVQGCLYDQECRHRFDAVDVTVTFLIRDGGAREALVRVSGFRDACCVPSIDRLPLDRSRAIRLVGESRGGMPIIGYHPDFGTLHVRVIGKDAASP